MFTLFLLPGFLQVIFSYLTSTDILRNVRYGPNPRNNLDIYLPAGYDAKKKKSTTKRPVVVFVSGGIWVPF